MTAAYLTRLVRLRFSVSQKNLGWNCAIICSQTKTDISQAKIHKGKMKIEMKSKYILTETYLWQYLH